MAQRTVPGYLMVNSDSHATLGRNGVLYFIGGDAKSLSNQYHAMNSATGKVLWSGGSADSGAAVAVDRTGTYLVSAGGFYDLYVDGYDAVLGTYLWGTQMPYEHLSSPVGGKNDLVYITGSGTYALETSTGKIRWEDRSSNSGSNAPVLSVDGSFVYAGHAGRAGEPAGIACFDATTGEIKWRYGQSVLYSGRPRVMSDGTVLVLYRDIPTRTSWIDAIGSAGKRLWRISVPFSGTYFTPGPDGTIYFVGTTVRGLIFLYALEPRTGKIRWQLAYPWHSEIAVIPDTKGNVFAKVYVGKTSETPAQYNLIALDSKTGEERWRLMRTATNLFGDPLLTSSNTIIVGMKGEDHHPVVLSLQKASGAINWEHRF